MIPKILLLAKEWWRCGGGIDGALKMRRWGVMGGHIPFLQFIDKMGNKRKLVTPSPRLQASLSYQFHKPLNQ